MATIVAGNYIPTTDANLSIWSANFAALISASPTTYGLTSGDATVISAANTTWQDAYAASQAGDTRGLLTIAAKDDAKTAWLATARPYAQQVANNAGVSSADKVALGVNPRTNTATKVPAPATQPTLSLAMALPGQHQMRYRDSTADPSVKAKPAGALQCQVFAATSATVVSDPATLPLVAAVTKSPFIISWDPSDAGKTAYYSARWVTRTGLTGPFGPIVPIIVM